MHLWAWLAGISLTVSVQLSALEFEVKNPAAITSVRLDVFDLAGRKIFSSGPVPGAIYKWYFQRDDGRPVANGVYLYIFFTTTADSTEHRSSVGKIAVRR
ncbi:MAG: hypothetical protein NZ930_04800 [Candidatus Bipolaricaulota bacterium]|nr:hypothetical protein [Candidatus Bipolaricaulota bacterium]MDW8030629.1 hypothetical protein [Candidatus Bipolaricaulota bacterium]